jgi:hypothetical protein
METTTDAIAPAPERLLPRVSWGAIFAGAFVSLAVWFVLYMLGVGIGLTTVEPDTPSSLDGILTGTSVWGLIAPIIGLFVGGMVVGRMVGPLSRASGAVYGVIVWSVSAVAALFLIWTSVSAVVGSAARMATGVASGVVSSVGTLGSAAGGAAGNLQISTEDLVVPINQRLEAMGKPTIEAGNLERALNLAVQRAIQQGSVDREILINAVAEETALTRQDAEQVANQLAQRVTGVGSQIGAATGRAGEMALQALESVGKGLIWLVISLLVSLGAAIGGATLIVGHEQKRATRIAQLPATR